MIKIAEHRAKIVRAKDIARTTDSKYLRRDMQKFIRRAEKELREAERYMKEAGYATRTTPQQPREPEKGAGDTIRVGRFTGETKSANGDGRE